MTTKKARKEPVFTILEKAVVTHKPIAYPSATDLKTMAKKMELTLGNKPNFERFGFNINAHNPASEDNASLIVPVNKYVSVKDWGMPPYYYNFNQWFFDGAWSDNVPGKVTVKFDKDFRIQSGVIFLRVGGYQPIGAGGGYTVNSGNNIRFIKSSHNNSGGYDDSFVSQTISINIKTPAGMQLMSVAPIEITSNMRSWKFFDAHYDPRIVI